MNPQVEILGTQVLSEDWYKLRKFTYRIRTPGGEWNVQSREAYDRGNGAAILLYNTQRRTVVLTRQFRLPTYVNGNASGMLIEACAGLLDGDDPDSAIVREVEEETGFCLSQVKPILQLYMSPGSVTEKVYFYLAHYELSDQKSKGGGTGAEEQIEVLELDFDEALKMVQRGEICDGKTLILLYHLALGRTMEKKEA